MMEEIWLPVIYPGMTAVVSSLGRYNKSDSRQITSGHKRRDGRCYLNMKSVTKTKARWLCYAFFPSVWMRDDMGIKWEASHIDSDIHNDILSNLEPVSTSYNRKKAWKNPNHGRSGAKRSRPVEQLAMTGEFVRSFPSVTSAAVYVKGDRANIQSALGDKIHSAYGFKWRYADQSLPGEIWTDCDLPQHRGTAWSNLGRIRTTKGVVTDGTKQTLGYRSVIIMKKSHQIHRVIMLEADMIGYLSVKTRCETEWDGPHIDHIDRDRANNKLENLRWVTRKENAQNV